MCWEQYYVLYVPILIILDNSGWFKLLSPFYRKDKQGTGKWRLTSPRSRTHKRSEAKFISRVPALKSQRLKVQRTKARTLARRRETRALPRGGAKPEAAVGGADPSRRARERTCPGKGGRRPRAACTTCRSLSPAPRQRAPWQAPPPPLARREANARSLPLPSACGKGGGSGRCALASCVLAYVAGVRLRRSRHPPVAAAVPALSLRRPPPKGAGAWPSCRRRCRNAAGVHRPPELPGPGARCGALL